MNISVNICSTTWRRGYRSIWLHNSVRQVIYTRLIQIMTQTLCSRKVTVGLSKEDHQRHKLDENSSCSYTLRTDTLAFKDRFSSYSFFSLIENPFDYWRRRDFLTVSIAEISHPDCSERNKEINTCHWRFNTWRFVHFQGERGHRVRIVVANIRYSNNYLFKIETEIL